MANNMTGKGSEFYLGLTEGVELTADDFVSHLTNIGAFKTSFNVIEVEPELGATEVDAVAGLCTMVEFPVSGNVKNEDEANIGLNRLATVHKSRLRVPYGIIRPNGLKGVKGFCYVSDLEISELSEEGVVTFSATIKSVGVRTEFTKPVKPLTIEE